MLNTMVCALRVEFMVTGRLPLACSEETVGELFAIISQSRFDDELGYPVLESTEISM
ncbi:hypothetical protein [Ferrimonas gelatinilytica]|uniref:hypothetical protein n=1 Tax=Ferrimonas gelatinilytica TaxID=1255257 RepID=UPI0031E8B3EE